MVAGVEVVHWTANAPQFSPGDVVIEAFGCDPPQKFVAQLPQRGSLWINLEYLSAEPWVEECHALPSIQPDGQRKIFFFPGFTPGTGGLLREPGLLRTRDQWLARPQLRWKLLKDIGMPDTCLAGLQNGWKQVFVFCYPNAPVDALIDSLERQASPSVLIIPRTLNLPHRGLCRPHVHVVRIPLVDQAAFDRLLWSSDLNFVRGEDSLVRALWAGKPLVWQIYEQEKGAHLVKLEAWLARSPFSSAIRELMITWNTAQAESFGLNLDLILNSDEWVNWQHAASQWSDTLAEQSDLADSVIRFCTEQRRKG